jgi:hypothetical protein
MTSSLLRIHGISWMPRSRHSPQMGWWSRSPPLSRPVGDHLEQQLRADIGEGHRAQLIDADELDPLPAAKCPAEFVLDPGLHQFIDQDCGGGEPHPPALAAGRDAQG